MNGYLGCGWALRNFSLQVKGIKCLPVIVCVCVCVDVCTLAYERECVSAWTSPPSFPICAVLETWVPGKWVVQMMMLFIVKKSEIHIFVLQMTASKVAVFWKFLCAACCNI